MAAESILSLSSTNASVPRTYAAYLSVSALLLACASQHPMLSLGSSVPCIASPANSLPVPRLYFFVLFGNLQRRSACVLLVTSVSVPGVEGCEVV
eukprot:732606-Rhodomonas_salina.1